jgi:lysophospholipase L1-like esterase
MASVALLALVGVGCSAGSRSKGPPVAPGSARPADTSPGLFLAVGGGATRGDGTDDPLREAWPQAVFGRLPAGYAFVNLAVPGASVERVLTGELPNARSLHPTIIAVWQNVADLLSGVASDRYRAELDSLVRGLSGTGALVLVANTPPLDRLPAYVACRAAHPRGPCALFASGTVPDPGQLSATVDAYNAASAAVAANNGAVAVDVHAAFLRARLRGNEAGLTGADGLNLSAAGQQLVADAFLAALHAAGR